MYVVTLSSSSCSNCTTNMAARSPNTATALRRLMTEYKQLTSGGMTLRSGHLIVCVADLSFPGSPDGMFTAGMTVDIPFLGLVNYIWLQAQSPSLISSPGKR